MKKIAIIGHNNTGLTTAREIANKCNIPIVVGSTDKQAQTMELEINGVRYAEIEKQPKKQMSSSMAKVLMMATMFGAMGGNEVSKTRKRPSVDLIKEFELIQQKKSKLSRNDRDWVVFQFNKRFKKIT
jgi:UDP-N-acetylmuramoylalanine-D-glutamate ligase